MAGVILETYQGGSAAFAPPEYMQALRAWCDRHKALLVCDEVQAGFGRTGTLWGFEHYGIVPDLALFGKGISSSLPICGGGRPPRSDGPASCRQHDLHPHRQSRLLRRRAGIHRPGASGRPGRQCPPHGTLLHERLRNLAARFPQIGCVAGKGLVAGVACVVPGTKDPDGDLAWEVVERCLEKGVLMFAPVGFGGGTIKISPPLVITEAAIEESVAVLGEAFGEIVSSRAAAAR